MPYVITTKFPGARIDAPTDEPFESRRAVAALEGREVWNALYGVDVPRREDVVNQIAALPESGGTVGPLSDGTVIEVERVSPLNLASRIVRFSPDALLDCVRANDFGPLIEAFNSREMVA